jgi:hypothetical protein
MLAMVLPRSLGCAVMSMQVILATVLPSHAGDDGAKAQCQCRVMLAMTFPSHVGDGAAEATWLWRDVDVASCW